ncbi:unnamed protein product [Durusdinium trenchii]|uniref:Uncharacterized protein n=1 Tax=Durusdinium trenchii TaxID=1381693 RepID=A0ABP0NY41_9DINO
MAEAPPPKKRKLDGPWFRDCLQELDETVKTNVATKLDKFSETDLYTATFDALMSLLNSAMRTLESRWPCGCTTIFAKRTHQHQQSQCKMIFASGLQKLSRRNQASGRQTR